MNLNIFDNINLLVVEEESNNRKVIIDSLSSYSKINIIETDNTVDALDRLKVNSIDIIIVDVNMIDIYDSKIFKDMRDKVISYLIPVVVVLFTKDNKNVIKYEILNVADNFLFKPLEEKDLESNIYTYMKIRQDNLNFKKNLRDQWNIFKKINLLIVEDDEFNRELIISYLSYNKNINFIEAENGIVALDKLENNDIDIVLLDLHMPKMNGAETLREIRKNIKYKFIPVIIITSDQDEIKNFKILEMANGFLFKPIQAVILESNLYKNIKIRQENLENENELLECLTPNSIEKKEEIVSEKTYIFYKGFIKNIEHKLFYYLKSRLDIK